MGTTPQPPRPPIPPAPPRSGSYVIAIALLILAFIVLVSSMALWVGFRILTRGVHVQVNDAGGDKKEVSIKTPFGGIEVNKEINEAGLGLPIYPGARTVSEHNDATVNMQFGDNLARLVVGKFETSDGFDKVKDFYQLRLTAKEGKFTPRGDEFKSGQWDKEEGNFIRKDREGKTVFEIKRSDSEKVVALKDIGNGTRIELVRISHGKQDTN
jgi:hypothetical protein